MKALAIYRKVFGEDHPYVAIHYNNIGMAYEYLGDYDKAIGYYEKALAINRKTFGENHSNTANSYNNLGNVYLNKGETINAMEYYLKALENEKTADTK